MEKQRTLVKVWGIAMVGLSLLLVNTNEIKANVMNLTGAPTHIGTFEGSTTFTTSSSNGVNPGLYLEVMDRYGNVAEYESEDGVITVPDTKEGAYVTQAKFLGKTMYRDIDSGELLDEWVEGRDLELISPENAELITTGKNLFNIDKLPISVQGANAEAKISNKTIEVTSTSEFGACYVNYYQSSKISLRGGNSYVVSTKYLTNNSDANFRLFYMDSNGVIRTLLHTSQIISGVEIKKVYEIAEDIDVYFSFYVSTTEDGKLGGKTTYHNIQIEEITSETFYEITTEYQPYQSNVITGLGEVKLYGIDEVRDELDLITGEYAQRIGEVVLDDSYYVEGGGTDYIVDNDLPTVTRIRIEIPNLNIKQNSSFNCAEMSPEKTNWRDDREGFQSDNSDGSNRDNWIWVKINKNKLDALDEDGVVDYLKDNPITVQYELATSTIKTVDLNSTYTFGRVSMRDVHVKGKVKPLICSVDVPTADLTFLLDPNQEEGKQFIAPTFSLINKTPTSIRVTLKSFEQESDVFNDVLPAAHENWDLLDQEQSKDIALALVPKPSDGWIELNEGAYYVVDHQSLSLGRVKGYSTVEFAFEAFHGRAFLEELNPRYKLVFVFDF